MEKTGVWPQAFIDTCPDGLIETFIWVTTGWLHVRMRILDAETLSVKRLLLKCSVPYKIIEGTRYDQYNRQSLPPAIEAARGHEQA